MRVNDFSRVALDSGAAGIRTHDLLIASPATYRYATKPYYIQHAILITISVLTAIFQVDLG